MDKLDKKGKFDYWLKIVFLSVLGLAMLAACVYVLSVYPFGWITLLYGIGTFGGFAFCAWAVWGLYKEYQMWIKKEKEAEKQEE